MAIEYYIIDLETLGLNQSFHDITEISIIRYSDRMQFTRLVKPNRPENASLDALRITNKTMADLQKGDNITDVINDANYFLNSDGGDPESRCMVAHNASFDRKFLYTNWERHNKIFPANLWLCTLALSKKVANDRGLIKDGDDKLKFNLNAACDLFYIKKVAGQHSAVGDTRNTYLLLKNFFDANEDYINLIKRIPHE